MIHSHLAARRFPSCPVATGYYCRWAKAAGEESPSGMLLPAAGAAVAAGPASTGSVAHLPHPIRTQKPLVLVTELSANPIGAQKPFISGTKCWLLLYSFPETVILGHGLRAERTLMGKVKFQGRHLARISATQVLPMGKVPTTKLDLAR